MSDPTDTASGATLPPIVERARTNTNGFADRLGEGFALALRRYTHGDAALWLLEAAPHPSFCGGAPLRMILTDRAVQDLVNFAGKAQDALRSDGGRRA